MIMKGYSIIEIMVTIVIVATFAAMSIPTYNSFIKNNKASSLTRQLEASLLIARSTAVQRNIPVSICGINSSYNGCLSSSPTNWINGWMVFTDIDGDGTYDTGDGDTIIELFQTTSTLDYPVASAATGTFTASGFVSSAVTFTINPAGCSGDNARTINLATTGRSSTTVLTCS